jgi:hypothetical protein
MVVDINLSKFERGVVHSVIPTTSFHVGRGTGKPTSSLAEQKGAVQPGIVCILNHNAT